MFTQYKLRYGEKRWMFQAYLGFDSSTGKTRTTTRRGFKTKREAKIALSELELNKTKGKLTNSNPSIITFEEVYNNWLEQYKNTVKESTFVVQKKL